VPPLAPPLPLPPVVLPPPPVLLLPAPPPVEPPEPPKSPVSLPGLFCDIVFSPQKDD
jgi:hypothetical protein